MTQSVTIHRSMAGPGGLKQKITGAVVITPSGLVEVTTDQASLNIHGFLDYKAGDTLVFPHHVIDNVHLSKETS